MSGQLKAAVCLGCLKHLIPSVPGSNGGCAAVAVAFGECCMEHMKDEVWVYSEHSLKTKGLGKAGGAPGGAGDAVALCPVLGTQLDTVSSRDRGREKC